MNDQPRKPDLSHLKDLADSAHELLDNKAFTQSILSLRKHWFDELLMADTTEQVLGLRAMIKALEAIPQELTLRINDYKKARHDNA